jgi:hypothetical protein
MCNNWENRSNWAADGLVFRNGKEIIKGWYFRQDKEFIWAGATIKEAQEWAKENVKNGRIIRS